MISLYLLSHQDDELGILHELATARARGERPVCVYLTDGAWAGVSPGVRNAESLRALTSLGVAAGDVHFLGERLGIPDGRLVEHLELALAGVTAICEQLRHVSRVVMQAWEGGHQDHDATHLVGRAVAGRLSIAESSRQFYLYRAAAGPRAIAFAAPIPAQGKIEETRMSVLERFRYLAFVRFYRSQAHVMLGLSPRIAQVFLFGGRQTLQHLPPIARLNARPAGRLLYEQWQLYTYETFVQNAAPFVRRRLAAR